MAEPLGRGKEPLKLEHLFDDFAGGQVADEAVDARGAEGAAHRTADLRADAGGAVFLVVAQQDALDPLGVAEFEQEFLGAVGRLAVIDDAGGPDLELGGQLIAQRDGQVGHLVEAGGPLLEEPLSHLSRPICRQAVLDEPVAERSGSLFEDGGHNAVSRSRCTGYIGEDAVQWATS